MPSIIAQDVGLRFVKSYDKTWTAQSKLGRLVRMLSGRRKPVAYHHVLENINLEIQDGERVGILGREHTT